MAKSGMNPKVFQYLMGHSDISVTFNTYTYFLFLKCFIAYKAVAFSKSLNEEIIIEAFLFFIVTLINEGGFSSLPLPLPSLFFPSIPSSPRKKRKRKNQRKRE